MNALGKFIASCQCKCGLSKGLITCLALNLPHGESMNCVKLEDGGIGLQRK